MYIPKIDQMIFITEINHISNIVENGGYEKSPLNIDMGIKTMEIINLAFKKMALKNFYEKYTSFN